MKNTDPGQNHFGSSRPVQVRPPTGPAPHINHFDPTAIAGLTTNPSFPSGHTTYAYTNSILLGMMTPELYQSMLSRGSEFANSRIVLGVHYPLDIIASRSLASYDLSQAFTNPDYINNAATTGTAINLPSSFTAAAPELNSFLSAGCGGIGRKLRGEPGQPLRAVGGQRGRLCEQPDLWPADAHLEAGAAGSCADRRT